MKNYNLINNQNYIRKVIKPNSAINGEVIKSEINIDKINFKFSNNHSLPVEIIGIKTKDNNKFFKFNKGIILPNKVKTCREKYVILNQLDIFESIYIKSE